LLTRLSPPSPNSLFDEVEQDEDIDTLDTIKQKKLYFGSDKFNEMLKELDTKLSII
jgi:hypothetical protein